MFKEPIRDSLLLDGAVDNFFRNKIPVSYYDDDVSLPVTLRALTADMEEPPRIYTYIVRTHNYSVVDVGTHKSMRRPYKYFRDCSGTFADMIDGFVDDHIGILNLGGITSVQARADAFCHIEQDFVETTRGWEKIDKITDFFRKSFSILCFVNKQHHNVLYVIDNLNYQKLHYMQPSLILALSWVFKPGEKLPENKMRIINSLNKSDPTEYIEATNSIINGVDIIEKYIKSKLSGYEKMQTRCLVERLSREIERMRDNYNNYLENASREFQKIKEKEAMKLGYLVQEPDNVDDVMNFFLRSSGVSLNEVVPNGNIIFTAKTFLNIWDEDLMLKSVNNSATSIYEGIPSHITIDEVKIGHPDVSAFYKKLFIDREFKLRTCAAFRMSYSVRPDDIPISGWDFNDKTYMPNTHIQRYSCMGGYPPMIMEAISNGDIISAIEMCVASAGNLNFGDSTVARQFTCDLFSTYLYEKVIELDDGTLTTPFEIIRSIREEQKHEQEN